MTTVVSHLAFPGPTLELFAAAETAISHIPPAFPLSATVAVNPFLGQANEPRAVSAARLARVAGIRIFPGRNVFAEAFSEGRLLESDLAQASTSDGTLTLRQLRDALDTEAPAAAPIPTVADLAARETGVDWSEFAVERIGTWAASRFDKGQALWPAPEGGLYTTWRSFARRDLTPGIAGLSGFCSDVAALPDDPRAAFADACEMLDIDAEQAPLYFHRLLMTLGGWSQYARHLCWLAERDGGRDSSTFELLTIRLIWDALLLKRNAAGISKQWDEAKAAFAAPVDPSLDDRIDAALQEAMDRATERELAAGFDAGTSGGKPDQPPAIQAAFCIDVRSEVLRRALEAADPGVETIGFAGFFGLAITHRATASDIDEARAPVLLSPGLSTVTEADPEADMARRIHRRALRAWGRFKMAAVSAFAFVEAAGPLYLSKLVRDALPRRHEASADPAPQFHLPLADRIAAAEKVLRAMSLTDRFAPLVLLAGHGAHVVNAPHASALQCGACGGHAGDVNARLLAGLLNEREVRAGLRDRGIDIPEETHFIAGLHDTVSDEVTLFDDAPSSTKSAEVERLKTALGSAGKMARTERLARLPRADDEGSLAQRGSDWSEIRPEWGLAGCASFVAAPRRRSAGLNLGGRAFLHEYEWQSDKEFGTLELILTAPVMVASWISHQYNGSLLAPEVFGAGNKLIHNVTGGIGVIEGNGGPLRAGLPWQSVHDGVSPAHEAVRLKVVIEAPTEAISAVLEAHPDVRALFDNGWLALLAMDAEGRIAARYDGGTWQGLDLEDGKGRQAA